VGDDADQGVTDVVRGADLLASTARQIRLAQCLNVSIPRYLHVPLVIDAATGAKLSKQNGAPAVAMDQPLTALQTAWRHLDFAPLAARDMASFWPQAIAQWARRWCRL